MSYKAVRLVVLGMQSPGDIEINAIYLFSIWVLQRPHQTQI
jgi:hypothetical protein